MIKKYKLYASKKVSLYTNLKIDMLFYLEKLLLDFRIRKKLFAPISNSKANMLKKQIAYLNRFN